jgi:hypothetical protein
VILQVRARWRDLTTRHRWLGWLETWGISVASLLLGLATLLVFRRGLPHVAWVVGYLLLLWATSAVVSETRQTLEARGRHAVVGAGEYVIQTLHHNLQLFCLPAYYASATLTSVNALFLAAVAASAVVTAVDPWYARLVRPRPWLRCALLAFSMFAALNVALPLVGIQPILGLEASAVASGLGLAPAFRRERTVSWPGALRRAAALACAAALLAWFGRVFVPPAPLFLAHGVAARTVSMLEPVDVIHGSVPAATVAEWRELAAFTPIHAPGGLRQPIAHVWRRNGVALARIPLAPVQGGRAEGYRTWSRRRDLRPPLAGRYTVDVVTASDQLIGRVRFAVTGPEAAPPVGAGVGTVPQRP